MGTRAHWRDHVLDSEGRPISGANVYVYQQGTTTPIVETMYAYDSDHASSATTLTNPFATDTTGKAEFWLTDEKRVTIKVTKTGYQDQTFDADVLELTSTSSIVVKEAGSTVGTRGILNATNANDFVIADDAANNEVEISINRNAANGIAGLDASGDIAKAEQHPQTAYKDEANLFSAAEQKIKHGAAAAFSLLIGYLADTVDRFAVTNEGILAWGQGGSTARDTNLYRSAADTLKTDDSLEVVGSLTYARKVGTYTPGATTIDVANGVSWVSVSNTGATTITNLTNGVQGQIVTLRFNDSNTTINRMNAYLSGGVNFTGTLNDTLTLAYNGTSWEEVGRSVNA